MERAAQLTTGAITQWDALQEGTQDCRRAITVLEIFEVLRARYGIMPREARRHLNTFRKEPTISLHAYSELLGDYQNRMTVNTFCSSLGNTPPQRHLPAMEIPTLESAVHAGNDFTQVWSPGDRTRVPVRSVDEPEEEPTAATVANTDPNINSNTTLQQLMKTIQNMAEWIDQLQGAE